MLNAATISQHSTAQHSTAQHSTAQHSTAQLSSAQQADSAVFAFALPGAKDNHITLQAYCIR